jgi:protein disulfide-isomerase A1
LRDEESEMPHQAPAATEGAKESVKSAAAEAAEAVETAVGDADEVVEGHNEL